MANKTKLDGVLIEGVNIIEILRFLESKKNKYLAIILNNIEDTLDPKSEEYKIIRKSILDVFNDYSRSIVDVLFEDSLEK